MNKKIICISIIGMFLLTGFFGNASAINSKEISSNISSELIQSTFLGNEEEVYRYGIDFHDIQGNWGLYGQHAIKMSPGDGDCAAGYFLNLGCHSVEQDSLQIGIYFCDWGWFGDGPDLIIYNFKLSTWIIFAIDIGNYEQLTWKWFSVNNPNNYISPDDSIWLYVYCEGYDYTILDTVGAKFIPIRPVFKAWVEDPLSWSNVEPGDTRTGIIYVENIGDPGSKLEWEVSESLGWVSCSPTWGDDLRPGTTISITVTAWASYGEGYFLSGTITVENVEDRNDKVTIDIDITTKKKSRSRPVFFQFLERFPLLQQLLNLPVFQ